jgi:hypothetical protein
MPSRANRSRDSILKGDSVLAGGDNVLAGDNILAGDNVLEGDNILKGDNLERLHSALVDLHIAIPVCPQKSLGMYK